MSIYEQQQQRKRNEHRYVESWDGAAIRANNDLDAQPGRVTPAKLCPVCGHTFGFCVGPHPVRD